AQAPQPPPIGSNPFTNPSANPGATPPSTPAQQGTANSLGQGIQNLLLGGVTNPNPQANNPLMTGASGLAQSQLANPNPYNADNIQQMMSVLQQPILEQQQQDISNMQANMAARGLSTSSIGAGNLADI